MALEIDIKKSLPNFDLRVLFTAREGEIKVIIGPSGAGKTTLIRIIAGLERPDEGYLNYNEERWVDCNRNLFLPPQKRRVGLVFQDYNLFPHLNVFQNVNFAATEKDKVAYLLKLFGIWELRKSMPDKISGGERQRCAICQNLARGPRVLLLDEPLSALDTENRRRLRRELCSLKESLKIPIIHVTHDLHEALYLGDEILSLVEGRFSSDWLRARLEDLAEDGMSLRKWCESQDQGMKQSLRPLRTSSSSQL